MQKAVFLFYKNLIKPLRVAEVTLMSGFFIIGFVFAAGKSLVLGLTALQMFATVFFYILSVYTLNSYSDYLEDMNNPRLKSLSKISRPAYFKMTAVFLAISLALAYYLNIDVCILVIFSFCLWLLYYLPPFQLKSTVLGGTAIHFVAGILHFHIGYCSLNAFTTHSILLGAYFSLLLCMGHLNHELIDYEADKLNGIRNTTVAWGKQKVTTLLNVLFMVSVIYWIILYLYGVVTKVEFACFFAAPVILLIYILVSKVYLHNSFLFQKYYRFVFIGGGGLLIITRIIQGALAQS